VFQNGVLLKGGTTDYTATSGTSVVLATGASVSDVIEIIVYDVFSVGNFFNRTDSDSRYVNVDGDSMTGALSITTADNTAQLTLKSTDADANAGPILVLNRDSGSPADNDLIGKVQFSADDDGGNSLDYATINMKAIDVTDGSEDGEFDISTVVAGTSRSRMRADGTETIFNENSVDVDFRVESNGRTHAFFVDGGNNSVLCGDATVARTIFGDNAVLQVEGTDATSSMSIFRNSNDNNGAQLTLGASRGTSTGSNTIVQDGDTIGRIGFVGADGTDAATPGALISAVVDGTPGGNDMPTRLAFFTTPDGSNSLSERFRINNAGSVFVGNCATNGASVGASQTGTIFAVGNFPYILNSVNDASTRYHAQFFNSNGSVGIISTNGSNTTYATSSDYRLKENVNYTWDGTTELKKLKPCKFNFKADNTETLQGFLAHEVAEVVPNAVVGDKDEMRALSYYEDEETLPAGKKIGDVKERSDTEIAVQSLDSSHLVPLLTKALQESIARADALEARIKKLEDG